MKIVTNCARPNHCDVICELLRSADRVWMFVAYVGDSGMEEIEQALNAACARNLDLELYCDISQHISHPDALWRIFNSFQKTKTAKLFLWNEQQTFHPKLYCFFSQSDLTLVIGSANLTGGGIGRNLEFSAVETVSRDSEAARAVETFRSIIAGQISHPARRWQISRYERKYTIYKKGREKADRDARKEIATIRDLKWNELKAYLPRYQKDGKEQDFKNRLAKYAKAKKVLREMERAPLLEKSRFRQLYSELVGGGGTARLWPSDGLFRSKNKVLRSYPKVASLIRQIRANAHKTPQAVFRIGRSRKIPGFGVNLLTELMHTLRANRFAILNNRPLKVLKEFGCESFPSPQSFTPENYSAFTEMIAEVTTECGFHSLSQADHFLSYMYGLRKRQSKMKRAVASAGR